MEIDPNLIELQEKINFGQSLIDSLIAYQNVEGIQKLEKKINQELNFLKKILQNNNFKKEYLQCTNLTHFAALVEVLGNVKGCVGVCKAYNKKRVIVDIVADNGLTWIKVVARNPRSVSQIYHGDSGYGVRTIIDQAEEFLECAKLYPCLFKIPKISFVFTNGIDNTIAYELESLGIIVKGKRLKSSNQTEYEDINEVTESCREEIYKDSEEHQIDKINLDVSAMIAYVSNLTNGHSNYIFKVSVLTQQAEWERERPVKPILDQLFTGKRLICCETAKVHFDMIVNTVGGPSEILRAKELMKNVLVLPDDATVADTLNLNHPENMEEPQTQFLPNTFLPIGGKIKQRTKIIFRFGDNIQAMTVTSNDAFVRSTIQKGINFVVFVHESRALTEQKQATAQVIDESC